MCQHPAHQVNVSRKGILCAADHSKFFETPCILQNARGKSNNLMSCQSTMSHLISVSVRLATFTRFLVKHGLFQYYSH